MAKQKYQLSLRGYVGGYDFDADYVNYVLSKNADDEVHVLIDSLGGSLAKALSIVSAFREHGNVHVHYVGMNASAATIASLGAKHVSIDSSAMYLVHKCSMEFFQWASANSDKLQSIIDEAEQMKSDLEKMDANVAQMYASKCKRKPECLLELMKKGGWLSAKEALDWGFVDEITDYADDAAPVFDDRVAADMGAAGIPVPSCFTTTPPSESVTGRFIESLTNFFKNLTKQSIQSNSMVPESTAKAEEQNAATQQPGGQSPEGVQQNVETVSAEAHNSAIKAKDDEIAQLQTEVKDLKAEIAELKKAPGAQTTHVVDNSGKGEGASDEVDEYFKTQNSAQELYDLVH